jgi:2-polyprenyl-3-methyl-5-hydroxy-6-metoxy-1,4-benzoquinol methylase
MIDRTAEASFSKSVKAFGKALRLIIPITLRWTWFLIKNVNQPQVKKSERFWDMISAHLEHVAQNEALKQGRIRRAEKLPQYLRESDVVLDYGCANGAGALEFAGRVKAIQGIDFSARMIAAAKRKAAAGHIKNVAFTQATIFDEQLKSEAFDVVLAWGILHLVEDRPRVLARIDELLKPGGLLISATECLGEKKSAITSLLSFLMKIGVFPAMLKFFTVAELEAAITRANFQLVQTDMLADNPIAYFIAAKKPERA